jgi:hypothetical protein
MSIDYSEVRLHFVQKGAFTSGKSGVLYKILTFFEVEKDFCTK